MRTFVLVGLTLAVTALAIGLDYDAIERADSLYEEERNLEALALLEDALATAHDGTEQAEVLWRLARVTLAVGEDQEDDGVDEDQVLATYESGEQYGIRAVAADPDNHLGYFWQSANIGKWGQARGILNALFRAAPMRDLLGQAIERNPDHAGSFYVLGQLYAEVPGVISFGNDDYAVSLARKSIDLHEADYRAGDAEDVEHDYYIQLASHLIQRDWSARRRAREKETKARRFAGTTDRLRQGWYYEGTIDIPDESDRAEAEALLRQMRRQLEAISVRTVGQERQLESARELLLEL